MGKSTMARCNVRLGDGRLLLVAAKCGMAKAKESKIPPDKLVLYEKLLATRPEIERKGDVHPYTSCNGHMFTYLDQTGRSGCGCRKKT